MRPPLKEHPNLRYGVYVGPNTGPPVTRVGGVVVPINPVLPQIRSPVPYSTEVYGSGLSTIPPMLFISLAISCVVIYFKRDSIKKFFEGGK